MKHLRPCTISLLTLLVIHLTMAQLSWARSSRIQEELHDPTPPVTPLRKALGNNAYQRAMKSGKYHYVGNKKCRLCHRDFFVGRMKDPHVYTYERLVATGYQKNGRCLICHTTGYSVKTGFTDFKTTPDLVGVQCEGCHGPGSVHVSRQAKEQGFGIPQINFNRGGKKGKKKIKGGFLAGTDRPRMIKRMCLSCHTKRWGKSFPRTAHGFKAAYDSYKTARPGDDQK